MPLSDEIARALRRDVDEISREQRRHTVRLDQIERELADRYVLPVAPPPGPAIAVQGYGPDTTTIILKAVDEALENKRKDDAVKIVDWGKGLRNKVAETLVILFCVAVAGTLATLLVMQAARTMSHAEPATPHELDHGAP